MFLCFSFFTYKVKEKYGIKSKQNEQSISQQTSSPEDIAGVALDGYDLVAIYENHENKLGTDEFNYPYSNVKLLFASQENLDKFSSNPYKYMPEYSGYDAYELSYNNLSTGKAEFARNIKGKIYLFNSTQNRDMFLLVKDEAIETSASNWEEKRR